MKLKLIKDYNYNLKKGDTVEVDKIEYSERYAGRVGLRVIGPWKKPRWMTIFWFIPLPEEKKHGGTEKVKR